MDWSCRVRITLFSVVVDAFHVQEEVAIQLFLRIIIFFMYSLCTPFATVSLEFGIVFLWVLHTYPPPPPTPHPKAVLRSVNACIIAYHNAIGYNSGYLTISSVSALGAVLLDQGRLLGDSLSEYFVHLT